MCASLSVDTDEDAKRNPMYAMNAADPRQFTSTISISNRQPILETEDLRKWVPIDLLPRSLQDSINPDGAHGAQKGACDAGSNNSLSGAGKIKAWARQTKKGFEVRIMRRKARSQCDEYTDLSVERDSGRLGHGDDLFRDTKYFAIPNAKAVSELSSDSIQELATPQTSHELSGCPLGHRSETAQAFELDGDSAQTGKKDLQRANSIQHSAEEEQRCFTPRPLLGAPWQREILNPKSKPVLTLQTTWTPSPAAVASEQTDDRLAQGEPPSYASNTEAINKDNVSTGKQIIPTAQLQKAIVEGSKNRTCVEARESLPLRLDTLEAAASAPKPHGMNTMPSRTGSDNGHDSGYHSEPGSSYNADTDRDDDHTGQQPASRLTKRSTSSALVVLNTVDEDVEPERPDNDVDSISDNVTPVEVDGNALETIVKLALLKLAYDKSTDPAASNAQADMELRAHKVSEAVRFETDTDVEPPSPSERKSRRVQLRPKSSGRLGPRRRGNGTRARFADRRQGHVDSSEASDGNATCLERRLTMPRTMRSIESTEDAWKVTILSQKKLLGYEHQLVLKAKLSRLQSREQQHRACSDALLEPLDETETIAGKFFSKTHPDVAAFGANLKTLRTLLAIQATEEGGSDGEKDSPVAGQKHDTVISTSSSPSGLGFDFQHEKSPQREPLETPDQPVHGTSAPPRLVERPVPSVFRSSEEPLLSSSDSPVRITAETIWNSDRAPHEPRNDFFVLSGLALEALMRATSGFLFWLRTTYGPEPEVTPGKVRVRWTCSCGQQLFDDFTENRVGAARELERYLNRPRTYAPHDPNSPITPSSYQPSPHSSMGMPPSSQTSLGSVNQPAQTHYPGYYARSPTSGSLPGYNSFNSTYHEPRYLLTCANEDRFTPKVTHLNIPPNVVLNDQHLAQKLREHYAHVNRQWWKRLLKLRGLVTIEFVQFEIHRNR